MSKLVNESLQEGAVKDIAMDIEAKEKALAEVRAELDHLNSIDRKEIGRGGQYDSSAELDADIADAKNRIEILEKEIANLRNKIND